MTNEYLFIILLVPTFSAFLSDVESPYEASTAVHISFLVIVDLIGKNKGTSSLS